MRLELNIDAKRKLEYRNKRKRDLSFYFFLPNTLLIAFLTTVPAFSISFLVKAALTQILILGLISVIS